ncbi:unnamed protein product, partial [Polarella glacialis]
WLAVRLDSVSSVEGWGGGLRSRRCLLKLQPCGRQVFVRSPDAAATEDLLENVRLAVRDTRWREGSYEAASMGGLQRILGERAVKQQATEQTLDVALADLDSLRRHAVEAAAAAKQVVAQLSQRSAGDGKDDGSGVKQLLEEFGLLQSDGSAIACGGQQEADVVADVSKVCMAALEKKGNLGTLLAHDVFCLVNRSRGTALVSPDEVMSALRTCTAPGSSLRLRTLGPGGAIAVSLARTSDDELDSQLLALAEAGPLSAFELGQKLKLTAAEARYLLHDAEARAVLVRDDAPECVFFHRNFFEDF